MEYEICYYNIFETFNFLCKVTFIDLSHIFCSKSVKINYVQLEAIISDKKRLISENFFKFRQLDSMSYCFYVIV